ncbi:diacylglycerol kinase family protein [Erysipelothrix urinaevulpis]|uniref:diacylglycerol/lipid kinase family protein n=1 Tax=Erysipelothrix urinaevulpis TaxID=2683717 RepID=UPI001357E402|nr:diacylglycerol kinase family protein [Erysipelothrix urinaevulpis]
MKKHVFIINPASGVGRYRDVLSWIEEYFYDSKEEYEIRYTEYIGHASEVAQEYHGDVILYAVGGDGTAHEVLNGINEGVEMAVIPVGTGNDFWKMIQYDKDLRSVLFDTIEGEVREIDIGLANGRKFLNCANLGLDAEVNKYVNSIRHPLFPRKIIYIFAAFKELVKYKPIEIEVEINGSIEKHRIILSSFMNGKWYGGGFKSAPLAQLDDQKLDVCLIEDIPLRRIWGLVPKYYRGKHLDIPEVTYQQVSSVRLKSETFITLGCDGELFEYDDISISIAPDRLKFRIPKGSSI